MIVKSQESLLHRSLDLGIIILALATSVQKKNKTNRPDNIQQREIHTAQKPYTP